MKNRVSLVLSSGGARGIAHIGAIEELTASGYEIESVTGCSMGTLVGGLFCTGHLDKLKEMLKGITAKEIFKLADISVKRDSFIKGEKIIRWLESNIPDVNIEDLPIQFRCVATDIKTGREVVFDHGSLYQAIRSSISMPIFFRPVELGDMLLVDGGVLNPLPINLAPRQYGDLLVAVNVSAVNESGNMTPLLPSIEHKSPIGKVGKFINDNLWSGQDNMISMMMRTTSLMIQKNTELMQQLHPADVMVNIPMDRIGDFDYDRAAELIELGRQAMHEKLGQL